jgi:hypothetical protein
MAAEVRLREPERRQQLVVRERQVEHVVERLDALGSGDARMQRGVDRVPLRESTEQRRPPALGIQGLWRDLVDLAAVEDQHPLARRQGTLAVHSAGRRGGDPLSRPGEVDLTAHVNWDDLLRVGEKEGLATRGIFRQGRYLAEAGILDLAGSEREKWRVYRLVDPEGMGEEISVLVQSRGM